jgi:hypothetical protein
MLRDRSALSRTGLSGLCLLASLFTSAQEKPSKATASYIPPSATGETKATLVEKLKLTPVQQRGLRLLKAAEAQAGELAPDMRAVVLWQAAQGYERVDPSRRVPLLNDAFRAAVSIPDDNVDVPCFLKPDECHSKPWLETQILSVLTSLAPQETDELLPQAEPDTRHVITGLIISRDVKQKKFDHAEELLRRASQEKDFPYNAAAELMVALPPARASERVVLFNLAMSNFQSFGKDELMRPEDLGTLIVRFSKDLPAPAVLEAVDLVLKQAKDVDEGDDKPQMSLTSQKGSVSLSYYEYRLFEFLPVLEELDSSRAESLLKEHRQVATALKRYPSGMLSLDPTLRDTPLTKEEERHRDFVSATMRNNPTPTETATDQEADEFYAQIEAKVIAVNDQLRTDPKQALNTAMTLPLWNLSGPGGPNANSPRADALARVAVATSKTNPDVARKALEEILAIVDQVSPVQAARLLTRTAETYLNLGEPGRAEKTLKQGMKIAGKLYESDVDSSNPNLAMKAQWPSTGLWRKLIMVGAKVSPEFGEQLISEVPDPEILTLERVAYANSLLGGADYPFRFIQWRKDQNHNGMFVF